jgi:hypothetical protein
LTEADWFRQSWILRFLRGIRRSVHLEVVRLSLWGLYLLEVLTFGLWIETWLPWRHDFVAVCSLTLLLVALATAPRPLVLRLSNEPRRCSFGQNRFLAARIDAFPFH